jgi:hypothetical protein
MTVAQMERRLIAVEKAVDELRGRFTSALPAENWLEKLSGSFKDEPAFEEVLDFGRAIRAADRPAAEPGEEV